MVIIVAIIIFIFVYIAVDTLRNGDQTRPATKQSAAQKETPSLSSYSVAPYNLNKNELPQGTYVIGRDIPPGTYDFFVVYGNGGKFEIRKYDANGNHIEGTWDFYWVGLEKGYEKRELLHIRCPEGYTLTIKGNVILKIVKSQQVQINL